MSRRKNHSRCYLIMIGSALVAAVAANANAHTFHVCLTQAEWNPVSKKLEISMRIDATNLENALRRRYQTQLTLEQPASESRIRDYIAENLLFEIQPAQADSDADSKSVIATHHWVGYEIDGRDVWAYLEVGLPNGPDGIYVEDTILHEAHHPVNTLIVKTAQRSTTLTFTEQKTRQQIWLSPNELPNKPANKPQDDSQGDSHDSPTPRAAGENARRSDKSAVPAE